MKKLIQILLVLMCFLHIPAAFAQIEVRVEPVRHEFLLGESIVLKITFLNQTDRAVTLKDGPDFRWLNFAIKQRGVPTPVSAIAIAKFPALTLHPGTKRSFQTDIKPYYNLSQPGNYAVTATIITPEGDFSYTSNNTTFAISQGGTVKSFDISARGMRLKTNVKLLKINGKSCLFGQVVNQDTKGAVGACFLGQYLTFMAPIIKLDSAMNLHIICQSTPEFFTYSIMNTFGKRSSYKIYRRSGGPIDLVSTGNGLRVIGLTPYTPKQREQESIHGAADRPQF